MGPVDERLAKDHRRIDALLAAVIRPDGSADLDAYEAFRGRLLRHIGIEEKIVFPEVRRLGRASVLLDRLKADHAKLALLLTQHPSAEQIAEVRAVLEPHNGLEEAAQGAYAEADVAVNGDASILARIDDAPEVRLRPLGAEGPANRRLGPMKPGKPW